MSAVYGEHVALQQAWPAGISEQPRFGGEMDDRQWKVIVGPNPKELAALSQYVPAASNTRDAVAYFGARRSKAGFERIIVVWYELPNVVWPVEPFYAPSDLDFVEADTAFSLSIPVGVLVVTPATLSSPPTFRYTQSSVKLQSVQNARFRRYFFGQNSFDDPSLFLLPVQIGSSEYRVAARLNDNDCVSFAETSSIPLLGAEGAENGTGPNDFGGAGR